MLYIPPDPTTNGQLKIDLLLSTEEWHGVTSRSKDVLARLRAQNELLSHEESSRDAALRQQGLHLDGSSAGSPLSDRIPSSLQQGAPALQSHAAPALSQKAGHAEQVETAASRLHTLAAQPAQKAHQPALPGSGLPAALQAPPASSALEVSQQESQAQAPQIGQIRPSRQEGAIQSQQAARTISPRPEHISQQLWDSVPAPSQASPPQEVGTWTTVWRTDALDSDGSLIRGLAHVPRLPGLAGGDGHAGYLISAANQTLNLYECSASGGRGEASLQLMHQLSAETQISMLAADASSLRLLASAQDAGRATHCVSVHSLNPELGLFEPQGRMPLPPISCPVPETAARLQQKPQVASVHDLGGPLTGCCAASFGLSLVVYSTKCAPGEIPKPKASWQAHSTSVTSLHASAYGMQLWSGAQDGTMHAWDMRYKPSQPAVKLRQVGAARALCYVREHCLQSGSSDGTLHVWDVRYPQQALRSLRMPENGGITASALGPFRDALVVGTDRGGVFAVSMADEQYSITQCARLETAVSHICWNTGSGEVYAAAAAQVAVLRQS